MINLNFIYPKYINNFKKNQARLIKAACIYAKEDPDFLSADSLRTICKQAKISVNAFYDTYKSKSKNCQYSSSLAVFLRVINDQEKEFVSELVKTTVLMGKDYFSRDEALSSLLSHISKNKALYILDLRRKRYELLFFVTGIVIKIYEIKPLTLASNKSYGIELAMRRWAENDFSEERMPDVSKAINRIIS